MKRRGFLLAVCVAASILMRDVSAHPKKLVRKPFRKKQSSGQKKIIKKKSVRQQKPVSNHATLGAPRTSPVKKNIARVHVYKKSHLDCCEEWVEHLTTNGFTVKVSHVDNPSEYSKKLGVPKQLGACHTAVVNGYVIEGHVPAEEIKRLIKTKPAVVGLAVPGMPSGAPGFGSHQAQSYNVILLGKDGHHMLYRHYGA